MPYPGKLKIMYPERKKTKRSATAILWIVLLMAPALLKAQNFGVSEIITDYGGFWKSGVGNINPVKPDNSHNLLAFTFDGQCYSTGANDNLLHQKDIHFKKEDFKALPVSTLTGTVNSNTKIGLGAMYDGVYNGSPATKPENKIVKYLSDGLNGLDMGTCAANLPAGDVFLSVSNLKASAIGDGVPDLLITQIADPSTSSLDRYVFTDINGAPVGNSVDIVLSNLPVVGNWTADFYEASTNPMVLTAGFTQTDRPIRLWAADFSAFGITSAMLSQIAYFKIRLNGNSDVAFVAYNGATIDVNDPLPAMIASFQAKALQNDVAVSWKTLNEINTDHFDIQSSSDGIHFTQVYSVKAAGNSSDPRQYSWIDENVATGKTYYRIAIVDKNGGTSYSTVVVVSLAASSNTSISIYPNPTTEKIYIRQNAASGHLTYQVRNIAGVLVMQKTFSSGSRQNAIDVTALSSGAYFLICIDDTQRQFIKFIKQ